MGRDRWSLSRWTNISASRQIRNMDSISTRVPDLGAYRAYLTVLARGQIPTSMQARLDASDVVQETLLEAYRKRDQYQGGDEPGKLASWLRQLLSCTLLDALRTQQRGQRDVRRELDLRQSLDESALGLEQLLIANDSSPSERIDRRSLVLRLSNAIEHLPELQRQAIVMRYCHQRSLDEIATQLQKTKPAVAGLLKRGLTALREHMVEGPG